MRNLRLLALEKSMCSVQEMVAVRRDGMMGSIVYCLWEF